MIYLVDMEHPGLVVFPTHRLVRDLPDFNVEKVLDGCREYFDVTEMNGTDNMESELAKLYDEGIRILCRKRKMVQACAEKS